MDFERTHTRNKKKTHPWCAIQLPSKIIQWQRIMQRINMYADARACFVWIINANEFWKKRPWAVRARCSIIWLASTVWIVCLFLCIVLNSNLAYNRISNYCWANGMCSFFFFFFFFVRLYFPSEWSKSSSYWDCPCKLFIPLPLHFDFETRDINGKLATNHEFISLYPVHYDVPGGVVKIQFQ